ncbi:uncharacterized protein LOC128669493 isoform X5 [Plodia interpunctella]|uniref:uncharacterized protein LOC128669493 isoform X5 n=1 Tax=Plodia interpunctella TaxID=58824 RepID=UPI00236756B2|nr:uncharacterized protein LOC128669493 isoform X5 [Plodia interpunctella]
MADDDDEEGFGGAYEDGHWIWDENIEQLAFISDLPPVAVETIQIPTKAPTGTVEFRDDVDLIEQIRFRRRYQRKIKPGQAEIITVQDVKDIALFTAPVNIMSPILINMLHLPTTERFIRALILYCAYYLQVADEMTRRILELDTKVRTPVCELVENEFRDNLGDLRLLVAKEYSTMLIELEMNRMFKSEIFNSVEHTLKTDYISKMAKEERAVLLGHCVRHDKKLNTRSPLMNEVFCHRQIDYRIMGLGVIKFPQMTPRLDYMYQAIVGDEENLCNMGVVLGIIGMPRGGFDTMLRPIPVASETAKSKASVSTNIMSSQGSKSSTSMRKGANAKQLYPHIYLPKHEEHEIYFPPSFPDNPEHIRLCSETQRRRWQNRLQKLLHPQAAGR